MEALSLTGALPPKEIYLNAKKSFFMVLFALVAGLALGFFFGTFGVRFFAGRSDSGELRERFEQVNRDLGAAIESQREASARAIRLQTELKGVTDYARDLEEGIRRLEAGIGIFEARTGSLALQLDGIIDESGKLADGINRANDSLEESRLLLDELGEIIRGLPGSFGQ